MSEGRKSGISALILKAMGLFTGVQGVTILCSVVRAKLIALWIGPIGVGLFGIYNQAIDSIVALTQLGLRQSVLPSLSKAKTESAFARLCMVVRRWNFALGIIGAFLTILFAPALSRFFFGDAEHTLGFVLLSVTIFCSAITQAELGILQGSQMLGRLAKASVWGAVGGLAVSVPMYYYWGVDSVVPSLVAFSVITTLGALLLRNRTPRPSPVPTLRATFREGFDFVRLGIFMTASAFITLALDAVFMAWLNRAGGTSEVGFYQAGYTIVIRYMGLVFSAIAFEYYPRLCRTSHSAVRTSIYVGHEILLALLVMLPMVLVMMSVDDLVLRLLYSADFEVASTYVTWGLAGTPLRAVSWCMAFVILARGDGRTYIVTECVSAAAGLALNIAGYYFFGLTGLGVAFILKYILYTLIIGVVYFGKYRMIIDRRLVWVIAAFAVIAIACAVGRSAGMRVAVIAAAVIASMVSLNAIKKLLKK